MKQPQLTTSATSVTASTAASMSRPLTLRPSLSTPTTSRTAPAKMRQTSALSSDSSGASSLRHYEADIEESSDQPQTQRPPDKDGSWSDSESGFLHPPIKSKLKGLLGTWGRNRSNRQNRSHRPLAPSISDPVPILQPPIATVSEYARRIEILASDLSNGSAMETDKRSSPAGSSSGKLAKVVQAFCTKV